MLKPGILRNSKDFSSLYKKGTSVGDKFVVVFYRKNGSDSNRKAFVASKKVGGSVCRNRARRLMKESCRFLEEDLKIGYDIIFIARNTIITEKAKCEDVKRSMKKALGKAGLLITCGTKNRK